MGRVLRAAGVTGAVLLLASCGIAAGPGDSAAPSSEGLDGVVWLLDDLDGAAPPSDAVVSLLFDGHGTLGGTGGCNRYSGSYELTGTELAVGEDLVSTMMACPDPLMEIEAAYLAALPGAKGVAVEGERLTLSDGDGNTVATFTAQSQDLAGTTWRITAYNNGKDGVVTVIDGSDAGVTFVQDGTMNGTGGCNRFTGAYTTGDGILTIGSLASTEKACEEPEGVMDQETLITKALRSAATYSIEGNRLELRTLDGSTAVQLTRA